MKQEITNSWLSTITFTEPNNQYFCKAYANGNTLAELEVDTIKVYKELKVAGRTPLKVTVTQKLHKTFEMEEKDDKNFLDLIRENSMEFSVVCQNCGALFHNPDEELKEGIYCPDCNKKA
jgi:hypothetical protein